VLKDLRAGALDDRAASSAQARPCVARRETHAPGLGADAENMRREIEMGRRRPEIDQNRVRQDRQIQGSSPVVRRDAQPERSLALRAVPCRINLSSQSAKAPPKRFNLRNDGIETSINF